VIDITAVLAARVRVLSSGKSNKNDRNDAYTVSLAALYGKDTVRVRAEDHATVLRVLSRRHTQRRIGARRVTGGLGQPAVA
jgi:hypothetical protein